MWWHAHSDVDRTTVHGAIVVKPKINSTYPYTTPDDEFILILGEWWSQNVTDLYQKYILLGNDPPVSLANTLYQKYILVGNDPPVSLANTINGLAGDQSQCSLNDTFKVQVEQGKTCLLRVINATMSNEFFFDVADHNITVVGKDGSYTNHYVNEYIMITPGQTFDLLLEANQFPNSSAPNRYYINATTFFDGSNQLPYTKAPTVAILEYKITNGILPTDPPVSATSLPQLANDSSAAAKFVAGLHSLASLDHPVNVPQTIDQQMYITVSVNFVCPPNVTCSYISQLAASLNNASFQGPKSVDILDAYYSSIAGVRIHQTFLTNHHSSSTSLQISYSVTPRPLPRNRQK